MNLSGAKPLTVLGSINLDIIATVERLPTAGETVGGGILSRQPGGKGANQAAAAARLGGSARMIGAVGNDDAGREMLAALTSAGVEVAVARRSTPTGTALIVVDSHGENQIVVCPGANAEVSLDGVAFAEDDIVLSQLEVGLNIVTEAARRHPGFFALNAAPAQPLPAGLIQRCDLVIVNETEYQLIPGLSDARLVAVTYGKDGSALFRDGKEVARAAGLPASVINTIGAGDAFCAALVLGLRGGLSDEQALAAANAVGADAVGQASSQPELGRLETYTCALPRKGGISRPRTS